MVVQRYGDQVPGGAETAARVLAEHMAAAGHDVQVLTSCAVDYATWSDELPPGTAVEAGVEVTRLPVVAPRDPERFGPLTGRLHQTQRLSPSVQAAWMHEQGPVLRGFARELDRRIDAVEAAAFMTYLYPTTVLGLPLVAPHLPTVLHPTAHDEVPFRLPIVRTSMEQAGGLAYFSEEERELVELRWRPTAPNSIVPVGMDLDPVVRDEGGFRERYGLGADPYLLYLGRIDPNKGAAELLDQYGRYRARTGSPLRLVMMGAEMMEVGRRDGVTVTGFVDSEVKWQALSGAMALVQPSRQESFSIALAEAWAVEVPVLVQGECDVLAGFTRRAEGGLAYVDDATFHAAVELLLADEGLRRELGRSGRAHVEAQLSWPAVIGAYESLLATTVERFRTSVRSRPLR